MAFLRCHAPTIAAAFLSFSFAYTPIFTTLLCVCEEGTWETIRWKLKKKSQRTLISVGSTQPWPNSRFWQSGGTCSCRSQLIEFVYRYDFENKMKSFGWVRSNPIGQLIWIPFSQKWPAPPMDGQASGTGDRENSSLRGFGVGQGRRRLSEAAARESAQRSHQLDHEDA